MYRTAKQVMSDVMSQARKNSSVEIVQPSPRKPMTINLAPKYTLKPDTKKAKPQADKKRKEPTPILTTYRVAPVPSKPQPVKNLRHAATSNSRCEWNDIHDRRAAFKLQYQNNSWW